MSCPNEEISKFGRDFFHSQVLPRVNPGPTRGQRIGVALLHRQNYESGCVNTQHELKLSDPSISSWFPNRRPRVTVRLKGAGPLAANFGGDSLTKILSLAR
jgi:hypothetical protein